MPPSCTEKKVFSLAFGGSTAFMLLSRFIEGLVARLAALECTDGAVISQLKTCSSPEEHKSTSRL